MARRDTMPRFGSINLLDDQIAAAKVLISSTTGLDDWRNATDPTKVDGADLYAASISSAALAAGLVQYAEVDISSANILALFTTPKQLVAAVAASVLELIALQLAYDYGTTAYTIGAATNLQVKYTDGAGVAVSTTQAVTGMLDQVADQVRALDKLEASVTPAVNAALVLTLAVANPTLGDGTIHAKVTYRTLATGL